MPFLLLILSFITFIAPICADEKSDSPPEKKITRHTAEIGGKKITYSATAGFMPIHNEEGKIQANIFYISYHKIEDQPTARPVTFFFCGGPGASSVWLHLGAFGPKRVDLPYLKPAMPPFNIVDNPYSLLDITDLVFVDPVSTGYSRPAQGIEAKTFYSTKEDTRSLAEFIRLYITQNNLWESPKFIVGESFGGYRAVSIASFMHDKQFIYINGLILLSPALNYQTFEDQNDGNDLPYPLALPSYAVAAAYHQKKSTLKDASANSEEFAFGKYAEALFKGDSLSDADRLKTAEILSNITQLPKDFILRSNLRISPQYFASNLLRKQNQSIGLIDSRYTMPALDDSKPSSSCSDPSAEAYLGPFTAAINSYLINELQWSSNLEYLTFNTTCPWDFGPGNQYPSVQDKLRYSMTKNPLMQVFVSGGYYDLVTPYQSILYSLSHLNLDPSLQHHLHTKIYPAGHMPYMEFNILKEIKNDLDHFYKDALAE